MAKFDNNRFESKKQEYETPDKLFQVLDNEFHFTIDVCADANNTKVKLFYSEKDDALLQDWFGVCWMNPPYGREISKWVKKAYEESVNCRLIKCKLTVCLLPARTDTKWWNEYVMKADAIHFIKGRLKFSNMDNSAPFPSAIVIFGLYRGY